MSAAQQPSASQAQPASDSALARKSASSSIALRFDEPDTPVVRVLSNPPVTFFEKVESFDGSIGVVIGVLAIALSWKTVRMQSQEAREARKRARYQALVLDRALEVLDLLESDGAREIATVLSDLGSQNGAGGSEVQDRLREFRKGHRRRVQAASLRVMPALRQWGDDGLFKDARQAFEALEDLNAVVVRAVSMRDNKARPLEDFHGGCSRLLGVLTRPC